MKKSNAQAERHSNRAGPPRTSRPRTDIFEQNDTASSVVYHALAVTDPNFFFYFLIDYKHKHTATGLELYVVHARELIFFFIF
mgnify:CR=1 FL=1